MDVVMPKNNEEMLIKMAERFGYGSLCLLYEKTGEAKSIDGLQKKTRVNLYIGGLGKNADLAFADVSMKGVEDSVSSKNADVLYGFENLRLRDSLKQRSSGLDPVLCKMMSERKKIYCVDFGSILSLDRNSRAIVFGRLRQNLMLCRKYKINVAIASFASLPLKMRNPYDLSSFLAALGHDEGKRPLEAIEERVIFNLKKKEGKIIMEGVEVL